MRNRCHLGFVMLYYTQGKAVQIPVSRNELRGLILGRNEMAMYMMRRQTNSVERFLPPTIDDECTCKRCYSLDVCMLYRKASASLFSSLRVLTDLLLRLLKMWMTEILPLRMHTP